MQNRSMTAAAVITAATMSLVPATGSASDELVSLDGFYVGAHAGTSITDTESVSSAGAVNIQDMDFNLGPMAGIKAGTRQHLAGRLDVRPEFELSYARNSVGDLTAQVGLTGAGPQTVDADGSLNTWSGMLNTWFDYQMSGPVTPYVGGGIGFVSTSISDLEIAGADISDDSATNFGYQLGAGAAYSVTEAVDVELGYRYVDAGETSFDTSTGGTLDIDTSTHRVMAGVRYTF